MIVKKLESFIISDNGVNGLQKRKNIKLLLARIKQSRLGRLEHTKFSGALSLLGTDLMWPYLLRFSYAHGEEEAGGMEQALCSELGCWSGALAPWE